MRVSRLRIGTFWRYIVCSFVMIYGLFLFPGVHGEHESIEQGEDKFRIVNTQENNNNVRKKIILLQEKYGLLFFPNHHH
jgi:hypothetical protein